MYLWWSLCTLYLHARQVRVTVGDTDLCCCVCVTYFERYLTPLRVVWRGTSGDRDPKGVGGGAGGGLRWWWRGEQ